MPGRGRDTAARGERAGEAAHTIYEVAEAAGVSIATVSRVLTKPEVVSDATRARVEAAIDELNYVPQGAAHSLAARRNGAFGFVVPELDGPYYAELLSGFEEAASVLGRSVLVMLTRGRPGVDQALRRLAGRVDAIAVLGGVEASPSTLAAVGRKLPLVVVANGAPEGVWSFSTENHDSASQLAGHLLDVHRRRRLVFVGDPDLAADVRERHEGFVAAHEARGLRPAEPEACEPVEREGERVAAKIADGAPLVDAAMCANDQLAFAVMRTLAGRGVRVPDDVAVTGWDDIWAARYVTPALTTVSQPLRDLGGLVAERIHQLLDAPRQEPVAHRLPTRVVIRRSCGCR